MNCISKKTIFTSVKLLNIILSIYLVALSCLPCADMEVSSAAHTDAHELAKTTHDSEGHSHGNDKDLCSPFCSCNCLAHK